MDLDEVSVDMILSLLKLVTALTTYTILPRPASTFMQVITLNLTLTLALTFTLIILTLLVALTVSPTLNQP